VVSRITDVYNLTRPIQGNLIGVGQAGGIPASCSAIAQPRRSAGGGGAIAASQCGHQASARIGQAQKAGQEHCLATVHVEEVSIVRGRNSQAQGHIDIGGAHVAIWSVGVACASAGAQKHLHAATSSSASGHAQLVRASVRKIQALAAGGEGMGHQLAHSSCQGRQAITHLAIEARAKHWRGKALPILLLAKGAEGGEC